VGATVILTNLVLTSRINQNCTTFGIDSLEQCLNKQHFLDYPHPVEYQCNSRGFRDSEWPNSIDELKNAIWCLGDSFTVGIGSPLEHTWAWQLSKLSDQRVINISMDGASNQWISRTAKKIIGSVAPKQMAIMWTYTHRREHHNSLLSDEHRRLHFIKSTPQQDWDNFLYCKNDVEPGAQRLVQFTIPNFYNLDIDSIWNKIKGQDWPAEPPTTVTEFNALPQWILSEIKNLHDCFDTISDILKIKQDQHRFDFIPVQQHDIARDGHHFDLITAKWVAKQAVQRLCC
jgi:hypothetical protein